MKARCFAVMLLAVSAASEAFERAAVEALLNDPARALSARLADPVRKPLAVLEFIGVEEGMSVLDVYAGGGYYTTILSRAVGPSGHVFAQNSPRALAYLEGRSEMTAGETLARSIRDLGLDNVIRLNQPVAEIKLFPNSLDAVLLSKVFHDYYNRSPASAQRLLLILKRALKPNGVLAIIDHLGLPGHNNRRLHRVARQDLLQAIEGAGLVIEAESALLRNPRDSKRRSVFDPILHKNTDRILLRVRKLQPAKR